MAAAELADPDQKRLIRSVKLFRRYINAHGKNSLAIGTLTPGAWTVRFGTVKKPGQMVTLPRPLALYQM